MVEGENYWGVVGQGKCPAECPGDGVEVDHQLDGVAVAVVAGLRVGDDVGPAGQRCRFVAESKPVLSLDVDAVAADRLIAGPLVDVGRVVEQPLGLVDVR